MKRGVNSFYGVRPVHVNLVIHRIYLIFGVHGIHLVRLSHLMHAFLSSGMVGSKLAAHPLA